MRPAVLWLAVLLAAPAAAADEPAPAAVPTAEQLADPVWIDAGRKRFISTCAYCHGQQGEAGKVKSFKERPGWEPQKIHDVIANGRTRAGNVMPSWKASIPDAEIWQIVAYIKSLTPAEPPR
jgi:mono/diheme cytochrome c family protein